MIGFQQIVGGSPNSVQDMTKHLLTQTVGREQSRVAAYYAKGLAKDSPILEAAHAVAAGELAFSEAMASLMRAYIVDGGDIDRLYEVDERFSRRLATLAGRIQEGLDPPVAVLRPDIHPLVTIGLGLQEDALLANEEIDALLAGLRADGDVIEGKKYAVERKLPVDPRTAERRWSQPIGSYDFCPSADKSVSVAWAFAPPVEQAQIFNAHIEAAREAVAYIAEEVGRARVGSGGEDGFESGHVAWLEFTHHTARRTRISIEDGAIKIKPDETIPGDPDLHTHFLIPNAVFCESGRVGSLDTMAIRGFLFEADAYYHARLGTKLREAGFAVELDERTGAARMTAVPDEVRTLFSKRSNIGEALARKMASDRGDNWDDLSDEIRASLIKTGTNGLVWKSKGGKDDVADFDNWKRQAKALGWEPRSLQMVGPELPPLSPEQRYRKAYEIGLPWLADKLEHRSVVPHWDLRLAALRGLIATGTEGLDDVKGITTIMRAEGVKQYGEQTAIIWGKERDKRYTSVTTALHERDETEFVRLAVGAARDKGGSIPSGLLAEKINQSGLDFTDDHGKRQRQTIERLAGGGRFAVAVGTAGAGKTAMLKPLVASWKEMGRDVYGASLAWRQTDDLAEAGIDKRNLKAFSVLMDAIKKGDLKLNDYSVVAVDELGLLGTRQGLELLRARAQYGFTVVALGDDKQCGSIEAGAIVDLTRRALGADQVPEILTTKRQQSEREREIVGLLREGRAADALDMKRQDGTAEMVHGGPGGVVSRVAKLYAERLKATGKAPTISVPTNSEAHRISEAVRRERREMGLVGPDQHTLAATDGERTYMLRLAAGDHVRLFRSTRASIGSQVRSIGRNGSVLEVLDVSGKGIRLRADDGRVGVVSWGEFPKKQGRTLLSYGDAATIHTSQGSTADEHIFALPSGSQSVTGAAGYTASTRHRSVAYLITNEAAERIAVRESRPINDTHDITVDDKWANVAKNLMNQKKSDSALALFDKVQRMQRGAVKAFHHAVRPDDPRRPDGYAAELVHRMKLDRVVEKITRGIGNVRDAYLGRSPGLSRS